MDAHDEMLLELAGEQWDLIDQAGADVRKNGLTYLDRLGNERPRPTCRIMHDATSQFARLLKDLDLNIEPPEEAPKIRRRF